MKTTNTWRLKKVAVSLLQLRSAKLKKHNARTHPAREKHPILSGLLQTQLLEEKQQT